MNKQDNVPQVKTVEDEAEALLTVMASVPMPATIKPETSANLLTLFRGFKSRIAELEELLQESALQIEYLHKKFKETGSGNSVLSRIDQALKKDNNG